MIDPHNITDYHRDQYQLEEFLVFTICVAGKKATQIAKKVDDLFYKTAHAFSCFKMINIFEKNKYGLIWFLQRVNMGKYKTLVKALSEVKNVDVKSCTVEKLESIHGIGPKTARFFILHSRKNARVACLDTHILSWLREQGYENVPKQSPQNVKTYAKWEKVFLDECHKRSMLPADLDLEIWRERSGSNKKLN